MRRKNAFLTFCCSLMPGVGQMYQGYMKRGMSILILFFAAIAITGILGAPIFALPIPIIIIFSFFDTYNIRNKQKETDEPHDEYIWQNLDKLGIKFDKISKKNNIIGILLIVLGIYILFNIVFNQLALVLDIPFLNILMSCISRYLPPIVISAIAIGLGIKFISKK